MAKSKRTRAAKRRASRRRRAIIRELLARGKSIEEIARWAWCSESTVREHVGALRRAAVRRMVTAYGPGAAEIGDLLEGLEAALQKVLGAEAAAERRSPNYRELVKLETRLLRELMGIRRELARVRLECEPESRSEPESESDLDGLTFREMLERARELGIDTTPYETASAYEAASRHETPPFRRAA